MCEIAESKYSPQLLFCCSAGPGIAAQLRAGERRAELLVRGPVPGRGLGGLPHQQARYQAAPAHQGGNIVETFAILL